MLILKTDQDPKSLAACFVFSIVRDGSVTGRPFAMLKLCKRPEPESTLKLLKVD